MSFHLDLRLYKCDTLGTRHILVVRDFESGVGPREAEMLTRFGLTVQLTRRDVVAQTIDLVIRLPKITVCRVEVMPNRVADPTGVDLATRTIRVHPNDAANSDLVIQFEFFNGLHVIWLSKRNVELAIRAYAAHTGCMVETLLLCWNQLPLCDHDPHRRIWSFKEKLGCGKGQDAITFCNK
jgi:hypothetical protein